MTAFKQTYGSNIHDITNLMLHENMIQSDYDSAQTACFDGDIYDSALRNKLPALADESFRDQQGEDDCQRIQSTIMVNSLVTNSTSKQQLGFCATASSKTPP